MESVSSNNNEYSHVGMRIVDNIKFVETTIIIFPIQIIAKNSKNFSLQRNRVPYFEYRSQKKRFEFTPHYLPNQFKTIFMVR